MNANTGGGGCGAFYSFFSLGNRKDFMVNATSRSLYSPERETVLLVGPRVGMDSKYEYVKSYGNSNLCE